MKNYNILEAIKETAFLFPNQPFGDISEIDAITKVASDAFEIEIRDGRKFLINLDEQSFRVIE